jgi:hypothetical protein
MGEAMEDWAAWDATAADGLDSVPWSSVEKKPRRVGEKKRVRGTKHGES